MQEVRAFDAFVSAASELTGRLRHSIPSRRALADSKRQASRGLFMSSESTPVYVTTYLHSVCHFFFPGPCDLYSGADSKECVLKPRYNDVVLYDGPLLG